jgi:cytochrome c-type biogenesis protein CcmH/NrfG
VKGGARTWWLVVAVLVAVFILYLSFTGRWDQPRSQQPATEEEFPVPEKPPSG